MTSMPLRNIFISDFRRLDGHHTFPLDAPVVLIHGPNGAGKTSVLSAIEMSLTGEIRSMRRHDPRYTAHLPSHGQDFASIRVEMDEDVAENAEPETMTVGGSRVEGAPALTGVAAQFFAERCYLDQVSLGQLLELYQYTEGQGESALARFVNELLGLEQLDALRTGLADANDLRNLKRLSPSLADADANVQSATDELARSSGELSSTRQALEKARRDLLGAVSSLGLGETIDEDVSLLTVADALRSESSPRHGLVAELDRRLTALGGRIETLAERPSTRRLDDARVELDAASADLDAWTAANEADIDQWRSDVAELQLQPGGSLKDAIDAEIERSEQASARQNELSAGLPDVEQRVEVLRAGLRVMEAELSEAQVAAGTLVEGLGTLRDHAVGDVCPVCDRRFGEISDIHLTEHIDRKLAELTDQGARLRDLRQRRDSLAAELQRDERTLDAQRDQLWSDSERNGYEARQHALRDLRRRFDELEPAIAVGREIRTRVDGARESVESLEAAARNESLARSELREIAASVAAPEPDESQPLQEGWQELSSVVSALKEQRTALLRALELLQNAEELEVSVTSLKDEVAEVAERKALWESRVHEARRRQAVARKVHDASSRARATIVQRVFTESLNDVWRSVFTRLAPREPFVPTFGIPSTSKTALDLTLETVHVSGEAGGPPQMMLSAGNLNTAALSLFIALHLAVEPIVPCLVLDDPVQSMDEVHISQLAGLLRVLSKHHGRQLVVAVHERELFQYLTLELSPAFESDELITIELGSRLRDEDGGVTRHTWSPDRAIAV